MTGLAWCAWLVVELVATEVAKHTGQSWVAVAAIGGMIWWMVRREMKIWH